LNCTHFRKAKHLEKINNNFEEIKEQETLSYNNNENRKLRCLLLNILFELDSLNENRST